MQPTYIVPLALMLLLPGRPAFGQATADLLQKGIYTQETVGDIDGAIKIYRQIVASATESRALAAQAQYRLGECLLKKGDRAGAVKAFESVVRDYPEQKELAAQASQRLPGEATLMPAPWADGELAEYRIKLPGGAPVGTLVYAVESNPARPGNLLLTTRAYTGGEPQQWSVAEVERDTMRPITTEYRSPALGDHRADFEARQVRFSPKGKEARSIPLDGHYWENEEALWVMRRMPLATGYKTTLPVLGPTGATVKLQLTVHGIEDVQVQGGRFKCFKVELSLVKQVFYFAVDAPRQLVKIEIGGPTIELVGLRRVDTAPVSFRDEKTGLAATLPPGWLAVLNQSRSQDEAAANLLDPQGRAYAALWATPVKTPAAEIPQKLRDGVEEKVKSRTPVFKDYRLRPASVQPRQVDGHAALSFAADYLDGSRPMVEYFYWVQSENARALFLARAPADEFPAFQKRFDPIVESAKLK